MRENCKYVSINEEISVGFIANLKAIEVEAEASLEAEFEYTGTKIKTQSYINTYTGDYEHDYVIFSACLYDIFFYEVVSGPDPGSIGKNCTIHIPNEPDTYKWDLEYYNSHNTPLGYDLGSETFNHTIGYLPSYSTKEKLENKSLSFRNTYTSSMQVGKGAGVNTIEIDLSTEVTHEFEWGIDIDWKLGGGIVGVGGGLLGSIGGNIGFGVGWGRNTMFSGTVGDISKDNDYANYHYKFGLCVYKMYIINASTFNEVKMMLLTIFGFDPSEVEFGNTPPSGRNNPYLDYSDQSIEFEKVTKLARSVGLRNFLLGQPYYVVDYWVELPEYWGEDAQQIEGYAEDVSNVLANLDVHGWTFLSLPILILFVLYQKRNSHFKNRKRKV